MNQADFLPRVTDELDLMTTLVPLERAQVIELGCGNARIARDLLKRFPLSRVTGLEVDAIQHAKNLQDPQDRLTFIQAGAQTIPLPDQTFDVAWMLKSLHHVPHEAMRPALLEVGRVVRPGGLLYVSEPIYDGALNDIVRLYNDEGTVRAWAQAALDEVAASGTVWQQLAEQRFATPVSWDSFEVFESRMMRPTYADHHLDTDKVQRVREAFERQVQAHGKQFVRPMHVRVFRRTDAGIRPVPPG